MGVAKRICKPEELLETDMAMARMSERQSSNTLKVGKATVRAELDVGLTEGVEIEAEAFASLFDSKDKEIGVHAFFNRETPEWKHE